MPKINFSKVALDSIIKKTRVHFYKPIQIAEILYYQRIEKKWNLRDLETYRNISKRWRDEISVRLVGRRSTSSQKYQDDIFNATAMPPNLLFDLGEINKKGSGFAEAYIYKSLQAKLSLVWKVWDYVKRSSADSFLVNDLVALFMKTPGLKRSIDKMYEIAVHALFSTIVRALDAQVTLEIINKDKEILHDFESFIKMVLDIDSKKTKLIFPAALYRVGVTNAADRGIDMWANFGPAVQVKHLTLKPETVEEIAENLTADRIIIVCLDSEKAAIESLLAQVGWGERIQGIITLKDLDGWYKLCLSKKYRSKLGNPLLKDLLREFEMEFPSSEEIDPFLKERGYSKMSLPRGWEIIWIVADDKSIEFSYTVGIAI